LNRKALENIRRGYLYVAREDGKEIKGSRRDLDGIISIEEYQALWRQMQASIGEGCMLRHSAEGDVVPW
jgi:hypothetical protein